MLVQSKNLTALPMTFNIILLNKMHKQKPASLDAPFPKLPWFNL